MIEGNRVIVPKKCFIECLPQVLLIFRSAGPSTPVQRIPWVSAASWQGMCNVAGAGLPAEEQPAHANWRGSFLPTLTLPPCQFVEHLFTMLIVLINVPSGVDKSTKATEATW